MSDHYKVGVLLAMTSNHAQVLGALSRGLLGINADVSRLNENFGRLKLAIGGAFAVFAGEKILGAMGDLVRAGADIVHQQELMKVAGMSNKDIAVATAKAYQTSAAVQTTTISENLKHLRELRYAFGNLDVASAYLDQVTKANATLNSVKGGGHDQVWEFVKSIELKGETVDPAQFGKYVDLMTQAVISSGGRVTPQQFFSAFKYGRTAMFGWDKEFVGQYLPRLIQSMSGGGGSGGSGSGGPGNALMSAFAKVVQGQMPKKAAQEFAAMGLGTESPIEGSAQSLVGPIKGGDLFQHNPYEWVQSVLMPALAEHGIVTPEAITAEISKMFPVRTASQIVDEMGLFGRFRLGTNSPFEKDAKLAREAETTSPAYDELVKNDPTTVMAAFNAQWKAMMEAMGSALVGPAIEAMKIVTAGFTAVAQFGEAHPQALKIIGEGLGALAIGLIGFGGAAVIAAVATLGAVPALIAGTLAALASIAAFNWSAITSALQNFADWLTAFTNKIRGFFGLAPIETPSADTRPSAPLGLGNYGTGAGVGSGAGSGLGGNINVGNVSSPTGPLSIPAGIGKSYGGAGGAQRLMHDLIHKYHWSPEAAAVMAGNVANEFNFNTSGRGDGGTSFGLAQWHADRARRLFAEAKKLGVPWNSWDLQVALMDREWRERFGEAFKSRDFGALAYLGKRYEGYSTNTFGARVRDAQRFLRGYHEDQDDDTGSAVIAPKSGGDHVANLTVHLDGRVLAKNTTKYMTKFGQHPAAGARLPDYTGTRPYTVGGD